MTVKQSKKKWWSFETKQTEKKERKKKQKKKTIHDIFKFENGKKQCYTFYMK